MKLLTVIGARPQFVKAATVSRVVSRTPGVEEVLVHTGQHYDANMSDVFFDELSIPKPHHHLGIGSGSHGAMTGRQLEAIETVIMDERPDAVLVYGDTNSTLAGALAATKLHIPVSHVEAGLRSFNRKMPEEINRVLTDHMATNLFAPTQTAMRNLRNEGIPEQQLHCIGDVMLDASLFYRNHAKQPAWFDGYGLESGEFVLATIHRAENTDSANRLTGIFAGLATSTLPVVLPLHPRTTRCVKEMGITPASHVHLVDPVGYLEMVWLESACRFIATDSGGVQKEAYFFNKPCVTMRDETEWVELVEAGWNTLVGADRERISEGLTTAQVPGGHSALYGTGKAADDIVKTLMSLHGALPHSVEKN